MAGGVGAVTGLPPNPGSTDDRRDAVPPVPVGVRVAPRVAPARTSVVLWEKHVLSVRGFKCIGRRSEYAM